MWEASATRRPSWRPSASRPLIASWAGMLMADIRISSSTAASHTVRSLPSGTMIYHRWCWHPLLAKELSDQGVQRGFSRRRGLRGREGRVWFPGGSPSLRHRRRGIRADCRLLERVRAPRVGREAKEKMASPDHACWCSSRRHGPSLRQTEKRAERDTSAERKRHKPWKSSNVVNAQRCYILRDCVSSSIIQAPLRFRNPILRGCISPFARGIICSTSAVYHRRIQKVMVEPPERA